jgi:hypothetical protein
MLRPDGDVEFGRRRYRRPDGREVDYLDVRVSAPGFGLDRTAAYRYQEWHRRDRSRWGLEAYAYDYFDLVGGGALGYHWHPIGSIDSSGGSIYHVRCVAPGGLRGDPHFRWHRMSLGEARAAFTRIDALGDPISCDGLYPLAREAM